MTAAALHLLAGVGLDLALGDPRWLPHPVRGFGLVVSLLERLWRKTALPLKWAGCCFWLCSVVFAVAVVAVTLPWLTIYWIYSLLAIRSLDIEANSVIERVEARDLPGARSRLAMIVGRDTAQLDEPGIVRAVIETVSENLSDGVVAPLFYLALFGPIGMAAYKAINTLDSMCGYKNEQYRDFGWASARMDDVANLIPARLSALLVWICALLPGFSASRSLRVTLRDASSQPSPNSGYPEAAFAGALGVRLGGVNYYQGVPRVKNPLGDPLRPLDEKAFRGARILLYSASLLMALFAAAIGEALA